MEPRSLREDLLDIDGVESADIDGVLDAPTGLRVRIAQNANQVVVGQAIRRVLSDHGLGTDTTLPGEASERVRPADVSMASVSELASASEAPASVTTLLAVDEDVEVIDLGEQEYGSAMPTDESTDENELDDDQSDVVVARIERVSVQEGRRGILVTVESTDGRIETVIGRTTDGGVEHAVVLAVARLAAPGAPDPLIVEIEERRVEGVDIVMIVLDRDGEMAAGSAVVGTGTAFALGRATWSAISE